MNDPATLQKINNVVSSPAPRDETRVSDREAGHDPFLKIFNEIESKIEATPPAATVMNDDKVRQEGGGTSKETTGEELSRASIDPALASSMAVIPPPQGSSTLSAATTEGMVFPDQGRERLGQIIGPSPSESLGSHPGEELSTAGHFIGGDHLKGEPVEDYVEWTGKAIGKDEGAIPANVGSSATPESVDSAPQMITSGESLLQRRAENSGPATRDGVAEIGGEGGETPFPLIDPSDETQKKNVSTFLSGSDQKDSEEAHAKGGSEHSTQSNIFLDEMAGMTSGEAHRSGLHPGDRISGAAPADPIQSKVQTGFSPLGNMSDETPLLHQIADKWASSHIKNEHSFRLQLEPERLGALQIDISVDRERIVAEIVTKHPFVKDLLEGNQERLRETLAEQGMKVDRFSVSIGDPGQGSRGREHPLNQGSNHSDRPDRPFRIGFETEALPLEWMQMKKGTAGAINLYV